MCTFSPESRTTLFLRVQRNGGDSADALVLKHIVSVASLDGILMLHGKSTSCSQNHPIRCILESAQALTSGVQVIPCFPGVWTLS